MKKRVLHLQLRIAFIIVFLFVGSMVNALAFYGTNIDDLCYDQIDEISCKIVGSNLLSNDIENLEIPSSIEYGGRQYIVTTIGAGAFSGKSKIKSVQLPVSLEIIESSAFHHLGGNSLERINLENVRIIESNAFYYCTHLKEIGSFASLEELGSNAFNSTSLKEVCLPGTVKKVNLDAFNNCKLSKLTFQEGIESIAGRIHEDIEELTIPSSCTCLELILPEKSILKSFVLKDGDLPLEMDDLGSINMIAPEVETFYLGRTVTAKYNSCDTFYALSNAKNVTISNNVKNLPRWCFKEFKNLQNIKLGKSVCSIPEGAFSKCYSLKSIEFNDIVDSIGQQAFYSSDIENIIFPNSLKKIGDMAFGNCVSLQSIDFGRGITVIDRKAFIGCANVSSLVIPQNITFLGYGAFHDMKCLSSVRIEDCDYNLEIISKSDDDYGYSGNIPLFNGSQLRDAYIGRNFSLNNNYYGIFKSANTLEKIEIGDKVTSLPPYALAVGRDVFGYSQKASLREVRLGKNLQSLGVFAIDFGNEHTYDGNPRLYSYNTNPPIWYPNNEGDYNILWGIDLYVPKESISAYSSANVWESCKYNIFCIEDSGINSITIDMDKPLVVYNLHGIKISNSVLGLSPGVYIITQGNVSKKIIIGL